MISIYGDESHDSMKQRAFAVAGLLGNSKQWDKLNTLWAGRTLGKTFHAADCESGYGDFRGFAPHERVRLHMDLTGILADSGLIGWGLGIDVASCKRAFPKMPRAQIYCSAFLRC